MRRPLRMANTGGPAEFRFERLGQARQVAVDELPLQGDRRGRHHHRGVLGDRVPHRGDEVGQRLAGSGASLDRQVLAGLDRVVHCLGHRDLPGALGPRDARDRGAEQSGDTGQAGAWRSPACSRLSSPARICGPRRRWTCAGTGGHVTERYRAGDVSAASGVPASFPEWLRRPERMPRAGQTQAVPRTRSLDTTRQCRGAVQAMLHCAMRIRCAVQNVIACQARPPFSVSSSCPSMPPSPALAGWPASFQVGPGRRSRRRSYSCCRCTRAPAWRTGFPILPGRC